jgi:hypothetical protein
VGLRRSLRRSARHPRALLLGLLVTLAAVVAYSAYITWQVAGLRKLQSELIDRNRKDSLQLLRIQNDLNLLAVAMRDMIDNDEPYPLTAWSAQFQRIRTDLDDAMRLEAGLAPTSRTAEQSASLSSSLAQFWDAVDRVFALAGSGQGERCASANSVIVAGAAGGAEHDRGSVAGAEQRERRTGGAAHHSDLRPRAAAGVCVSGRDVGAILLTGFL